MSETVTTALIAAGAAVIAAILAAVATFFAASYQAKHKIRELEVSYQQQLQKNYLASAREHTKDIYIPLTIKLTELDTEFKSLSTKTDLDKATAPQEAIDRMKLAIANFLSFIDEMKSRGVSGYFISELDERLRSFALFIEASQRAEEPVVRAVIRCSVGLFGSQIGQEFSFRLRGNRTLYFRQILRRVTIRLPIGIITIPAFVFEANEIVQAPLTSRQFAERFTEDVTTMLSLIREVILGAPRKTQ